MSRLLSRIPGYGLAAAIFALIVDQGSKYIIVERLMRPAGENQTPFFSGRVIDILPVFDLRLSWNTGISFSLFNSGEAGTIATLLIIQMAVSLVLIWWLWQLDRPWLQIACGLIIGGALGNIVDRATVGAVADFLLVHWRDWEFPTFNLADTCITIGAGMWLLDAMILHPHHGPQHKDETR